MTDTNEQNINLDNDDVNKNLSVDDILTEAPAKEIQDYESQLLGLNEQISSLQQQIKDQEIRSLAHIQNLQRRHSNELEDAHKYATTKFAKEILPIRDYLEMALMDESGNLETIKTGVELTLKQLNAIFNLVSIVEINPLGEKFDPNRHNALRTELSQQDPNTVIQVLQKGYVMNNRILRPASVVISATE